MQEIITNKLVIPIVALAVVGVIGVTYTITHSGPSTANAQTAVTSNNTQGGQDKEVKDDGVSPVPSQAVQQKADTNENDKKDANGSTNEVEDGN
jgi:type IV secretory pathway VirB10-like protein